MEGKPEPIRPVKPHPWDLRAGGLPIELFELPLPDGVEVARDIHPRPVTTRPEVDIPDGLAVSRQLPILRIMQPNPQNGDKRGKRK